VTVRNEVRGTALVPEYRVRISMRLSRVHVLIGKARPRRFGGEANFVGFAIIALKRVIGMVFIFGFILVY